MDWNCRFVCSINMKQQEDKGGKKMKKIIVSALVFISVTAMGITGYASSTRGGQLARPCGFWCRAASECMAGACVSDMSTFAGKRLLSYQKANALEKKAALADAAAKNDTAAKAASAQADAVSANADTAADTTTAASTQAAAVSTVVDTAAVTDQSLCPHGYCIGQGLCPYSDCPNGGYCYNNDGYQDSSQGYGYQGGYDQSTVDQGTAYQGGYGCGYGQGYGCQGGYGQGYGAGYHHGGHGHH